MLLRMEQRGAGAACLVVFALVVIKSACIGASATSCLHMSKPVETRRCHQCATRPSWEWPCELTPKAELEDEPMLSREGHKRSEVRLKGWTAHAGDHPVGIKNWGRPPVCVQPEPRSVAAM